MGRYTVDRRYKDVSNNASGRIDTTITEVSVRPGDQGSFAGAAIDYVVQGCPEAHILGVWWTARRDGANYIYRVEWEEPEEEDG